MISLELSNVNNKFMDYNKKLRKQHTDANAAGCFRLKETIPLCGDCRLETTKTPDANASGVNYLDERNDTELTTQWSIDSRPAGHALSAGTAGISLPFPSERPYG